MAASFRKYLDKKADVQARPLHHNLATATDNIDAVVVIPALAEKDHLFRTLDFLAQNPADDLDRTLVICVINNRRQPPATPDQVRNNQETLAQLEAMVRSCQPLRLGYIDASSPGCELPDKGGVGLARKIGLDCGLALLADNARDDGLLVCLDADTRVEANYLPALRNSFAQPGAWAAVVDYAHEARTREAKSPEETAAVTCYEIFLRYHVLGLAYAGSPYAFPTIGSTMACTARAYVAVAGMNQRQAGEDFYFLQQLAKTGPVRRISETTVHPSPRPSWRVPFGTGQRVGRFLAGGQDEYVLYDPRTYDVLKRWLEAVRQGLDDSAAGLLARAEVVSPPLRMFLEQAGFSAVWPGLQKNNPDVQRRLAQFHRWFDGFKTIKLVHYLRDNGYPEVEMFGAIRELIEWSSQRALALAWESLKDDLQGQALLLDFLRRL
ncbi:MAG TPA: glycosyltransferase family A protein [Candidatus Bathyarchaeia archaeon]|nr:glycosyltransferase family A protein [Candidatus Bathyarchaeia archaeon]